MQNNFSASSQALLDGVVAVLRQQVIADKSAVESKTGKKTSQARLLTVEAVRSGLRFRTMPPPGSY